MKSLWTKSQCKLFLTSYLSHILPCFFKVNTSLVFPSLCWNDLCFLVCKFVCLEWLQKTRHVLPWKTPLQFLHLLLSLLLWKKGTVRQRLGKGTPQVTCPSNNQEGTSWWSTSEDSSAITGDIGLIPWSRCSMCCRVLEPVNHHLSLCGLQPMLCTETEHLS